MKSKLIYILSALVLLALSWKVLLNENTQRPIKYNGYLAAAKEQEELKIYKKAAADYEEALKIYDKDIEIHLKLAEALNKQGLLEDYINKCDDIISKFPEDQRAYLLKINYYIGLHKYDELYPILKDAKNKLPSSKEISDLYSQYAFKFEQITSEYDEVLRFAYGFCAVRVGNKWGYAGENGNMVIKPVFDYADFFGEGNMAAVEKDNEFYFIDTSGDRILASKEKFDGLFSFSQGFAPAMADGKAGFVRTDFSKGNILWEYAGKYINDISAIKNNGKWALRQIKGKFVTDFIYDDIKLNDKNFCFNNSVALAKTGGKYIMLDKDGKQISSTGFEDARIFESSQYAAVKIDGKWGFADSKGEIKIKPQYEDAESFTIQTAAVKIDGKWGYIDMSGNVVIEPQFAGAKPFSSTGIAAVKNADGKWTFIRLYSYEK